MTALSFARPLGLVALLFSTSIAFVGCDAADPSTAEAGGPATAQAGVGPFVPPQELFLQTRHYYEIDEDGNPVLEGLVVSGPKVCLTDLSIGKGNQGTVCNDAPSQPCPIGVPSCYTSQRYSAFASNVAGQFDPVFELGSFPVAFYRGRPYSVEICGQSGGMIIEVGTNSAAEVRLMYASDINADPVTGLHYGNYYYSQAYTSGTSVTPTYYTHPLSTGPACS